MPRGENALVGCERLALALLGLPLWLGACVQRPSEDRCRAMADHLVELERGRHEGRAAELAAAVTEEHRAELVRTCVEEGTEPELRCVLRTERFDQLSRCTPR